MIKWSDTKIPGPEEPISRTVPVVSVEFPLSTSTVPVPPPSPNWAEVAMVAVPPPVTENTLLPTILFVPDNT